MSEQDGRSKNFKNYGRDLEYWRKRHVDSTIELRKQKKEYEELKRRNISACNENVGTDDIKGKNFFKKQFSTVHTIEILVRMNFVESFFIL